MAGVGVGAPVDFPRKGRELWGPTACVVGTVVEYVVGCIGIGPVCAGDNSVSVVGLHIGSVVAHHRIVAAVACRHIAVLAVAPCMAVAGARDSSPFVAGIVAARAVLRPVGFVVPFASRAAAAAADWGPRMRTVAPSCRLLASLGKPIGKAQVAWMGIRWDR